MPTFTLQTITGLVKLSVGETALETEKLSCCNKKCPQYGRVPLRVLGCGKTIESRDTYRATGRCASCQQFVGVIRCCVDTIFGIEEDERTLAGPWRVY